jgi:hypothetical protein
MKLIVSNPRSPAVPALAEGSNLPGARRVRNSVIATWNLAFATLRQASPRAAARSPRRARTSEGRTPKTRRYQAAKWELEVKPAETATSMIERSE